MTNIKGIIATHRQRLEAAGLLRRAAVSKLSPQVAAMRPSLTKVRKALQERSPVIQVSPMAILFETTLPKIEPMLVDLGEERAEQIIGRLCEYGQEMISERSDKAGEHLEELFRDLSENGSKLKEDNGLEEVIETYRRLSFEGKANEMYLSVKLGDNIEKLEINDEGMISLKMASSTTDQDLIPLRRIRNLQRLYLKNTQVSDLTPLSGLTSLQVLDLWDTQVRDLTPLSDLTSLRELKLRGTQVSDIAPLSGLTSLQELGLGGTLVSDFTPLSGLTSLWKLDLPGTQIIDLTPLSVLTNLRWLNLGATQISDFTHLSGLASLQCLYLHGTQVSDLTPLSVLTRLQELYLYETQVSDTQIEELKSAIPGLVVYK